MNALPLALDELAADGVRQLRAALARHGRVCYASSLGPESIVLTDLIWTQAPAVEIFTIDTGRLYPQTHELIERLHRRYGRSMKIYHPDARELESWVERHGINGFRDTLERRLGCCAVRKLEPFRRAVAGFSAWVTGIRAEQSASRALARAAAWDEAHGLYKVSPLLAWRETDVWAYIHAHGLPFHRLHEAGYPSIGCAPCTRAVPPGADPRSGRWWWEQESARECGLHPRQTPADAVVDP